MSPQCGELLVQVETSTFNSIVSNGYDKLRSKWKHFGHSEEELTNKIQELQFNLKCFFEVIHKEEDEKRKQKEEEIETLREKVKKLVEFLKEDEPEILSQTGIHMLPLAQYENQLSIIHSNLLAKRDKAFQIFTKLNEEAKMIGAEIDEPPPLYQAIECLDIHPTEEILEELRKFIVEMQYEKTERENIVRRLRFFAQGKFWLLGNSPYSPHERDVLHIQSVFSKKLIEDLTEINALLEKQVSAAQAKRKELCETIMTLSILASKPVGSLPSGILPESLSLLKFRVSKLKKELELAQAHSNEVEKDENIDKLKCSTVKSAMELLSKSDVGTSAIKTNDMNKNSHHNSAVSHLSTFSSQTSVKIKNARPKSPPRHRLTEKLQIRKKDKQEQKKGEYRDTIAKLKSFNTNSICLSLLLDQDLSEKMPEGQNELSTRGDLKFKSEQVQTSRDSKLERIDLSHSSRANSLNDQLSEFERIDDLNILKAIGASKWHKFIHGDTIWEFMYQQLDINKLTIGENFHNIKLRFHNNILYNLELYGVSEREMKLYFGNPDLLTLENLTYPYHVPPFNQEYKSYEL